MDTGPLRLREAWPAELDYVEGRLSAADLPTADVREKPDCFYVAYLPDGDGPTPAGERVGVGGLERTGDAGLLRSVVVEQSARGSGYGQAIVERVERRAADFDVADLFLLTTGADGFFETLGYERIDRQAAPPRLRETPQFADLCPASATCMWKSL